MRVNCVSAAYRNMKYYKLRTSMIISIIIVFIVGITVETSIKNAYAVSLESIDSKLGADIIIAPQGASEEVVNALFSGIPSSDRFTISDEVREIYNMNEVEEYSDEILLSTLNAECCEYELQMIAIDINNCYYINNWLTNPVNELKKDEIIIGSDVAYSVGDVAKFFGRNFKVVGKLEKSDLGYDVSLFVNKEVGQELLGCSNNQDISSMVLLKLDNANKIDKIVEDINKKLLGTNLCAYKTSMMFYSIKNKVALLENMSRWFYIMFSCVCICALIAIFLLTMESRISEINVYKTVGLSNIKIINILFMESGICVVVSVIIGLIFSIMLQTLFKYYIQESIQVMYNINLINVLLNVLKLCASLLFVCLTVISFASLMIMKDRRVYK